MSYKLDIRESKWLATGKSQPKNVGPGTYEGANTT